MKRKILKSLILLITVIFILQINIKADTGNEKIADKNNKINAKQVEDIKNFKNETDSIKKNSEKSNTNSTNNSIRTKDISEGDSLYSTVKQGGPLMIFIIILGLMGLTIIFERAIFFIRHSLWKKSNVQDYLSKVVDQSESNYREQLDDELRDAFQIYINSAEKGMALLNGIGNIAPIFGFLGTVIGMISAFAAIAAATTVNARVVAVGIQVALVTTAGGLIVAAPILTSFHFFNHLIQNIYKYADEIIFEETSKLPSMLNKNEMQKN